MGVELGLSLGDRAGDRLVEVCSGAGIRARAEDKYVRTYVRLGAVGLGQRLGLWGELINIFTALWQDYVCRSVGVHPMYHCSSQTKGGVGKVNPLNEHSSQFCSQTNEFKALK